MAFPQLAAVSRGNNATNTVTASLSIMSGVNANDILLAILASDGQPNCTWDQSAAGTWTSLFSLTSSSAVSLRVFWKRADGTEGNKQLKPIFSAAEMYAYHISRWTGVYATGSPFEYSASSTITVSGAIPALAVTTGVDDYTWVALCAYDGNHVVSTYPTNYVNTSNERAAAAGGAGIGFASKEQSGTTAPAAGYKLDASDDLILVHLSIRPAAAGADQTFSAGLVASGLTFYTQSVTMRLNITVPHLASGLTHYSPSIGLGDVSFSAGLIASGLTFYSPTIQITAQSLNVGLVASGLTHYAPSFGMKKTVDVGLVASGLTFFTQSIAARKTVDVGLMGSGLTHYAPSIAGSLDVLLGLADFAPTFYSLDMYNPPIVTVRLRAVSLDLVELGAVELTNLNYP